MVILQNNYNPRGLTKFRQILRSLAIIGITHVLLFFLIDKIIFKKNTIHYIYIQKLLIRNIICLKIK